MHRADYNGVVLRLLKNPLLRIVAVFIVSAAAILACGWIYKQAESNYSQANQALLSAAGEKRDAEKLIRTIDTYDYRYRDLQAKQYFNTDVKLRWLEALGRIASDVHLIGVDYSIGALSSVVMPEGNYSDVVVQSMPIKLSLELAHEGDLIAFQRGLEKASLGLFDKQGCSLQRATDSVQADFLDVNVLASCDYLAYRIELLGNSGG